MIFNTNTSMLVTRTVRETKKTLGAASLRPQGFVPTMGALHAGHISLVEKAISECPFITVSIFVNPTQFNDREDLKNYPRTEDADLQMLAKVMRENDVVFLPPVEEIYPDEDKRVFDFGMLATVMEGLHRPGHFNGVAQVVSRLFDITDPDIAYFGQKDFQQIAIVKELVRQTGSRVRISPCPIVREDDGLAMSSRNRLLEPGIRKRAGLIYKTIRIASEMALTEEPEQVKHFVESSINSNQGFTLEYFEIVDENSLQPVVRREDMNGKVRYFCCIALRAGRIRLIDNIEIPLR